MIPRLKNERFILLRERLNMSQERLAETVGLTQSMISRIESGEMNPSTPNIIKLITFFNNKLAELGEQKITVDWLFFEKFLELNS